MQPSESNTYADIEAINECRETKYDLVKKM